MAVLAWQPAILAHGVEPIRMLRVQQAALERLQKIAEDDSVVNGMTVAGQMRRRWADYVLKYGVSLTSAEAVALTGILEVGLHELCAGPVVGEAARGVGETAPGVGETAPREGQATAPDRRQREGQATAPDRCQRPRLS